MGTSRNSGNGAAAFTGVSSAEFEAVLGAARGRFDDSRDFTIGIEEEWALLDPETLDLVPEFHKVEAAGKEEGLEACIAGELLASEIEFLTPPCDRWQEVAQQLGELRAGVVRALGRAGLVGVSCGTHPWADYREQRTIDAPYYEELVRRMQYVARRNNTFGLHVHVGVRGADRAVQVAAAMRDFQPLLLALSASSPFLDGVDSGLASARSMTFSRTFPRGNIAPRFRTLTDYEDYLRLLFESGSIITPNQVWWGVRPHIRHGTVELRMFDGQPHHRDSLALAALGLGLVAHLCDLHDAGELLEPQPAHLVDENLWRALRFGTAGTFVELPTARTIPAGEALERAIGLARAAGRRHDLGIDVGLDDAAAIVQRGCSALVQRGWCEEAGGGLRAPFERLVACAMGAAQRT